MTDINADRRDDIEDALAEISSLIAMARNGAAVAETETSERAVRYAVIAVGKHLDQIDSIIQEVEGLIADAPASPEPTETPRKTDAPHPGPTRTGRSHRGRRGGQ